MIIFVRVLSVQNYKSYVDLQSFFGVVGNGMVRIRAVSTPYEGCIGVCG